MEEEDEEFSSSKHEKDLELLKGAKIFLFTSMVKYLCFEFRIKRVNFSKSKIWLRRDKDKQK